MKNPWSLVKAFWNGNTPIYVHFGLTHRCNLTCAMCGLWKKGRQDEELTIAQIESTADNLRRLGTMAISLGGGEPFLRPDLPKIVKAFIDRGIETRILTNALAGTEELHMAVVEAGLRHISISLDTPHPQVQSEICHKPEIWEKIIERIKFWAEIIRKRGGTGILNCVVSTRNIKDIPQMLAIAKAYNFYLSLVPLERHSYQGEILACSADSEAMRFSEKDEAALNKLLNYILQAKRQPQSPIFNSEPYLKAMVNFLKAADSTKSTTAQQTNTNYWGTGTDCQTGGLSFSISPSGTYSMCHFQNDASSKAPKVYESDFVNWYQQKRDLNYLKNLRHNCRACLRPCWWEIALTLHNTSAFFNALRMNFRRFSAKPLPSPSDLANEIKRVSPLC